jgi:hypothetical protein
MALCLGASRAAEFLLDMGLGLPFTGSMGETHAMAFLEELVYEWRFRNGVYRVRLALAAATNSLQASHLRTEGLRRLLLEELSSSFERLAVADSDTSSDTSSEGDSGAEVEPDEDEDEDEEQPQSAGEEPGPDQDGDRES